MQHDLNQPTIDFTSIKLALASPDHILDWSHGEVTKPETINYRTQKPEKDGLFCEKIFGPTKDWQCYCGKYKGIRYKGIVCDKCGVLVTRSIVRRERMGHIHLAVPVSHIWFLRGTPSSIGTLLNMSVRDLERVTYFANFIVQSVDDEAREKALADLNTDYQGRRKELITKHEVEDESNLTEEAAKDLADLETNYLTAKNELESLAKNQLLPEGTYRELNIKYGNVFKAGIGAEAIRALLEEVELDKLAEELREEAATTAGQRKRKALKRLKAVEGMQQAGLKPEWMVISELPVIPPDLRPMVQLDGGRFAASDLNDLYRRVINRNNRLKKLYDLAAPEVICRNEKRMLQEAVDALIDNNARRERAVTAVGGSRKKLKSLTDLLKGKQGRFRQNLLGKRVDYSGRSVIVVGPHLKLDECGLPKMMALELFKPFVISRLIEKEYAHNVKSAARMIERARTEVWDTLEEVITGKYVLLNRAPTLHRLSIQAFKPVLIEGKAIQLHPLVCAAFNADFDGDQMAVHVPLSDAAQKEAREIMLASRNLLKPASGEPIVNPSHEIVLGCFYMTSFDDGATGEGKAFSSAEEAIMAYQQDAIHLRAKVRVKIQDEVLETSVGRILFNDVLPEGMSFQNDAMTKSKLKGVLAKIFTGFGGDETAQVADRIKAIGYQYATESGFSLGMDDLQTPKKKAQLLDDAEKRTQMITSQYQQGLITNEERKERTVETWKEVGEQIEAELTTELNPNSSTLAMDIESGARATVGQANQMAGMKGLVLNSTGGTIELPVKSNYKEGLSILEYFIASHGARKGLTDTALKTAESGYLTRRLVDVAQDVMISADDCGDKEGYKVHLSEAQAAGQDSLAPWIVGRYVAADVKDGRRVLVKAGELVTDQAAREIAEAGIETVTIRSILKCSLTWGICKHCYGIDLARGALVETGEAVGIMAAQSIGEPGTQLTMRTFHAGGVASAADITQGLPRVEEIFEARNPRGEAILAEVDGVVTLKATQGKQVLRIAPADLKITPYELKEGMKPTVKTGDTVAKGDVLAKNETGKRTVKAGADGTIKVGKAKIELTHEGGNIKEYTLPDYVSLKVKNGDLVTVGQRLSEGSVNLQDMLRLLGSEAVERYIVDEVQAIYASQGQTIASKHIEVIIRQMFSRVRIEEPNDTEFITGDVVSKTALWEANRSAEEVKKTPATYEQLLMPISKISISSDSWLSAASFQETMKVLIGAALRGKTDKLRGLKENVIIGRLIPVGTGFRSDDDESVDQLD
ncbi:DNA-directed RNA polymerase subunit beta' [bacterium]|nr:MAG: DNA-directed RNA polymerase subunit beta' [bacterium]